MESLLQLREYAHRLHALMSTGRLDVLEVGRLLDETWRLKSGLASNVTSSQIDDWYARAVAAGAAGGKVCGAGGGGFLLFLARPNRQSAVCRALKGLTRVAVNFEAHGSQVAVPFVD